MVLRPNYIASWRQFRKVFINQFSTQHERKKPDTHMLIIWQEKGEALREFFGHFMAEKIKVSNCSDEIARPTFMSAVNNLDLAQSYTLQSAKHMARPYNAPGNICMLKTCSKPNNSCIRLPLQNMRKLGAIIRNQRKIIRVNIVSKGNKVMAITSSRIKQ